MTVAIIDYGSGNLRSAAKAFEWAASETGANGEVLVTSQAADLDRASHIVLPGVGAFADCKAGLDSVPGMVEALERNVRDLGKPFLGICVGMQLMAERGLEHGTCPGLGWISGEVRRLAPADKSLKIPHMGWNALMVTDRPGVMTGGLTTGADVYFVHSYHMICAEPDDIVATVNYCETVTAVIGRHNMLGTQFHPEKSQAAGLGLIARFLQWRP